MVLFIVTLAHLEGFPCPPPPPPPPPLALFVLGSHRNSSTIMRLANGNLMFDGQFHIMS